MSDEENFPIGRSIPRVDSFEIVYLGEVELTEEEKTWPVVRCTPRIDSFEFIDPPTK